MGPGKGVVPAGLWYLRSGLRATTHAHAGESSLQLSIGPESIKECYSVPLRN